MKNNNPDLKWLFTWFYKHCDGDWEHGKGIQISTLANPGWFIKIDLEDTELQNKEFKKIFIERSENDWFFCKIENGVFEGDCGPFNFCEILSAFKDLVEKQDESTK